MTTAGVNDLPITLQDFPKTLQKCLTRRMLPIGEILLQQGDAAKYLYWVVSGRMRLVSFVNDQMVTHYFVEAGELLGETALSIPTYGCTAIAEASSELMAIPAESFAAALKESAAFSERYLIILTHRFYRVKSLLELRSIHSARDRLLHYLVNRLMPDQNTLTLDKPLRAIASELAITPEALSRMLSRLQVEGILTRKKRHITFSQEWLAEDVWNMRDPHHVALVDTRQ